MMQLTLKLRLQTTAEQERILRNTVCQYTGSFNRVAAVGWPKRRVNGVELHHATYKAERVATDLPSQLVISARMKATEALASARDRKKKGKKVSCPRSRRCPVRYDARSATIRLVDGWTTLATVAGRQRVTFRVPPHHRGRESAPVATADLCEDRKGRLWLHVVVALEAPAVETSGKVVGVDLGVRHPAVTSTNQFLGHRHWREVEARYFRLRRALQAKDTKSAWRKLKRLGRRVNRFRRDCDHVLSKRIVQSVAAGTTIALEDLSDIRDRMKARKKQRRRLHSWSFHRLKTFLGYKAVLKGVQIAFVDARYTSQKCSRCGYRIRSNRQGTLFRCKRCDLRLDADLNAARNIAANHLAAAGMSGNGGSPVNRPIVGDRARHDLPASSVQIASAIGGSC